MNFAKYYDTQTIVEDNRPIGKILRRGIAVDIFPLYGLGGTYHYLHGKLRTFMWGEHGRYFPSSRKAIAGMLHMLGMNERFWRKRLVKTQRGVASSKNGCVSDFLV